MEEKDGGGKGEVGEEVVVVGKWWEWWRKNLEGGGLGELEGSERSTSEKNAHKVA